MKGYKVGHGMSNNKYYAIIKKDGRVVHATASVYETKGGATIAAKVWIARRKEAA